MNWSTIFNSAFRTSIIATLLMIILTVFFMFIGLQFEWYAGLLAYVVYGGAIVFGMNHFKDENEGFGTYGEVVMNGIFASLFAGILIAVFVYVNISFIDVDFLDNVKQVQIESMEKWGMPEDQIEAALASTGEMTAASSTGWTLVGYFFVGLVISLIAGFFVKREPEHLEE